MWSDRVERIVTCTDELARVRRTFGKNHPLAIIIEVGEMDQLSELHRLVWEETNDDDRSSDGESTGPNKA